MQENRVSATDVHLHSVVVVCRLCWGGIYISYDYFRLTEKPVGSRIEDVALLSQVKRKRMVKSY